VLGFNAIRSAQAEGKLCGIIALEPGFDKEWAYKHGIDPEGVVIARPDSGEEAFDILHDWVLSDLIDFTLFDSIGAMLKGVEIKEGGKANAGGQAGLITWGVKRILTPSWKRNKGIMFLNQIRDNMSSPYPGQYDSPGGWAVKHSAVVRVQLRPGKEKYTEKQGEGKDRHDVVVGRQLIAVCKRNKLSEGSDQRGVFDFYQKATEDHPVGVDLAADVARTGTRTSVVRKSGGWYYHESFPDGKLNGMPAIKEYIADKPEVVKQIRDEILEAMVRERGAPRNVPPDEQEAISEAA
jgi:recombination protein RecA